MIVAIDKHDGAWYSKKDRVDYVCERNRRGRELNYRYATIESVKEFKRFTFIMLPVNQFINNEMIFTTSIFQVR